MVKAEAAMTESTMAESAMTESAVADETAMVAEVVADPETPEQSERRPVIGGRVVAGRIAVAVV